MRSDATLQSRVRAETSVGLVRGVLAERIVVSTPADPFLDLRALSQYSSLSVRKLRDVLIDLIRPLQSYKVGGKVLVRRSHFDAWIEQFRTHDSVVDQIVHELLDR
jgi:hypothetical protein